MARIEPGQSLIMDIGPGGDVKRPLANRFIKVFNDRPNPAFIPDTNPAEKTSTYNYVGRGAGVRAYKGQYVSADRLYRNEAVMGTGPCWFGNVASGDYNTPPAADPDFTDAGVFNANSVNPNTNEGNATVRTGTTAAALSWQFYQVNGWGCPSDAVAKVSIRQCYI